MAAAIGNNYASVGRRWHAAINRALEKQSRVEGIEALDKLAEEFVATVRQMAKTGDITGFREFGDRMDGKSTQIVAGDPGGAPIVHRIEQVIVEPPGDERDSNSRSE